MAASRLENRYLAIEKLPEKKANPLRLEEANFGENFREDARRGLFTGKLAREPYSADGYQRRTEGEIYSLG